MMEHLGPNQATKDKMKRCQREQLRVTAEPSVAVLAKVANLDQSSQPVQGPSSQAIAGRLSWHPKQRALDACQWQRKLPVHRNHLSE